MPAKDLKDPKSHWILIPASKVLSEKKIRGAQREMPLSGKKGLIINQEIDLKVKM